MRPGTIVHQYDLRCPAARAFEVYVGRTGDWWHPDYTPDPASFEDLTIEPGAGGRVFLTHRGMGEFDIGRVTVWEPPERLVYSSVLGQEPDQPSEIAVTLTPRGGGCRFRFEHGGWHAGNAADRDKFTEWPRILDRFVSLAEQSPRDARDD